MDFLDLAKERFSARKFSDKKVEKDKLDLILEAGRVAPTAVNYQPQRILVVDDENIMDKLRQSTPYHFNAPVVLVICFEKEKAWKNKHDENQGVVDASIVTTHMMLETTNVGLGSTWVGHFDKHIIKQNLSIPEDFEIVALLPIGYISDECKPAHLHEKRLEIDKTVFYNKFC